MSNALGCALYARVSTTDQNCEMQLRELREYCARRGWEIVVEYVDAGWSCAKASRPQLDRLMQDAAQRRFDGVLVYKLDRFGRSVLNLNQNLAALTSYGVRFVATSQGLDTDASNPTSRLLLQILASVAEFERELICERTVAGVRRAKTQGTRSGKPIGRPVRVFRRDTAIELRQAGLSWKKIAGQLGVPVSTVRDACRGELAETLSQPVALEHSNESLMA
jgi:putative DNA-invertase from lambdoid prophage Rac